jgi:hypothetical protein
VVKPIQAPKQPQPVACQSRKYIASNNLTFC